MGLAQRSHRHQRTGGKKPWEEETSRRNLKHGVLVGWRDTETLLQKKSAKEKILGATAAVLYQNKKA